MRQAGRNRPVENGLVENQRDAQLFAAGQFSIDFMANFESPLMKQSIARSIAFL